MASTREEIIKATCDLMELQGYYGTGLNQIIRESGSPKGSLYYYFPGGKEELTAEALKHVGQIVLQRIKDNLAAVDAPAEAIRQFIHLIADNVEASGFKAGGPITTVALETASTSDTLRETCHDIYQQWIGAFAAKLSAGGMDDLSAATLAQVIISSLEGGIILSRTGQDVTPLRAVADQMARLVESSTNGK